MSKIISLLILLSEKDDIIGTYGTQSTYPSQIILKINTDETFYFQDFSDPLIKIRVIGNWKKKGNEIELLATSSNDKFHTIWSFKKNAEKTQSSNGLTFHSLLKMN